MTMPVVSAAGEYLVVRVLAHLQVQCDVDPHGQLCRPLDHLVHVGEPQQELLSLTPHAQHRHVLVLELIAPDEVRRQAEVCVLQGVCASQCGAVHVPLWIAADLLDGPITVL